MNPKEPKMLKALKGLVSTILIMLMLAVVTAAVLNTFTLLQPSAQAQLSGGSDAKNPIYRTVTVQPSKGSPGTGELWIYDKSATNWLRFDPTNVVIVQRLLGSTYTNQTLKITNGIGVTNGTLTFVNGMLVQP